MNSAHCRGNFQACGVQHLQIGTCILYTGTQHCGLFIVCKHMQHDCEFDLNYEKRCSKTVNGVAGAIGSARSVEDCLELCPGAG